MTDIVKKLRSPVDEKEDYFISQWPGEEPKTHDAVRFQAADEIERLRAALKDARVSLEGWADYASDYIKEKWDLKGDLARIDAALEGKDD